MKSVIILGGGGHARVLIDLLNQIGKPIRGILAPIQPIGSSQIKYLGDDNFLKGLSPAEVELVIGFGANGDLEERERYIATVKKYGFATPPLIHPNAIVCQNVVIGTGVQIMAGAIVQSGSVLGDFCLLNTGAKIDHDCEIMDYCHLGPGSTVCGGVTCGPTAFIGAGATVIPGIQVGSGSYVCAGATVINDVETGTRVQGTPAQPYTKESNA